MTDKTNAPSVGVPDGWMPIESAPKSADPILVVTQDRRIKIETGFYAHNLMHAAKIDAEECVFTHWMPLPPAPGAAAPAAQPSSNPGQFPAGWKPMPVDPTREMKAAGAEATGMGHDLAHHCWSIMAAKALAAPVASEGGTDEQCNTIIAAVRKVFGGWTGTSSAAAWERAHDQAREQIRAALAPAPSVQTAAQEAADAFTEEEKQAEPRIYAYPQDYERRADGKVVRKDRWQLGFRAIVSILHGNRHEFEINDIVEEVAALATPPAPQTAAHELYGGATPPQWIDDPHDIEQGRMLNPAWLAAQQDRQSEGEAVGYVTNDEIPEHRRAQLLPGVQVAAGAKLYTAPQTAAQDDLAIEVAAAIELVRARDIVEQVRTLPIGGATENMPTPFHAGYQLACEEIAERLGGAAPVGQPAAQEAVTEFNVGRWCKSEDDCIVDGIDFGSYEQGVADAAAAFGRNSPRALTDDERGKLLAANVDVALAEKLAMDVFGPLATPPAAQTDRQSEGEAVVTEFNVGRFCKSEDECIAQGIDFAAYERGVADAATAFGRNHNGS